MPGREGQQLRGRDPLAGLDLRHRGESEVGAQRLSRQILDTGSLADGDQVITDYCESGGFNLDYLRLTE
ncbi:hypothetical protein Areg01_44320 [Actinoplanes regularis]|nr:hypothetical protein Areg01_44320 [Actinoplanes regularis]